jgi:hypothetical protein
MVAYFVGQGVLDSAGKSAEGVCRTPPRPIVYFMVGLPVTGLPTPIHKKTMEKLRIPRPTYVVGGRGLDGRYLLPPEW